MKFKTIKLTIVVMLSMFSLARFSCAQSTESSTENANSNAGSQNQRSINSPKVKAGFLPVVTSSLTGGILGTPVEILRHSKEEVLNGQQELCGRYNNIVVKSVATTISLPFGVLSGVLQAPVWSFYNSIKFSKTEPFSKETFSLGTQ